MDIKKEFRDFSVKHLGNNGLVTDQYMGMLNPTNLTPYITEERRLNVAQMDVFSRLMMDRPEQGYSDLYQFAWRKCLCRIGNL